MGRWTVGPLLLGIGLVVAPTHVASADPDGYVVAQGSYDPESVMVNYPGGDVVENEIMLISDVASGKWWGGAKLVVVPASGPSGCPSGQLTLRSDFTGDSAYVPDNRTGLSVLNAFGTLATSIAGGRLVNASDCSWRELGVSETAGVWDLRPLPEDLKMTGTAQLIGGHPVALTLDVLWQAEAPDGPADQDAAAFVDSLLEGVLETDEDAKPADVKPADVEPDPSFDVEAFLLSLILNDVMPDP